MQMTGRYCWLRQRVQAVRLSQLLLAFAAVELSCQSLHRADAQQRSGAVTEAMTYGLSSKWRDSTIDAINHKMNDKIPIQILMT
jgi:hypothetical protein